MNKTMIGLWLLAFGFAACNNEENSAPWEPESPPEENRMAVAVVTRASEGETNVSAVKAGLYMVNRTNGQQAALQADGNYVNNLLLNYSDGTWGPSAPIYWQNSDVSADFYAYAPYSEQVADAGAMVFRVAVNQTSEEAFKKSDFLWGTVQDRSPLDGAFDLTLTHQLSRLTIVVTQGAGFSEGELAANDVSVSVGGSKTLGSVNLQTGVVTVTGEVADVKCYNNGDLTYSAILLPQQIAFANLVKVDWNGNTYTLQNSFKLETKKQYRLTIKLNKTQRGLDVGISGWDIIEEDFGGTVG